MTLPLLLALAASAPAVPDTTRPLPIAAAEATAAAVPAPGARHPLATASEAGMSLTPLLHAEQAIWRDIQRGAFPGAAFAVGRGERTVLEDGMGRVGWTLADAPVDAENTVYDLASLTKVVATTTAVMLLVEDGKLDLDRPIDFYLPGFIGPSKNRVSVRHLLTHTSGLPAGADIWGSPMTAWGQVVATPLIRVPGSRVEYSDLGFVLLWNVAERAAGEPLWSLLDRRVYAPLGMRSTTFLPGEACARCAPTGIRPDGVPLRGLVHDPISRRLGGMTGNAGLFSTAHDLGRFAAMLAHNGELDGVRVLRPETIRLFTGRQPGAGTRALGWDTPSGPKRGAAGDRLSPHAFGHTGFTGTSLWVDPERGTWTVLLANRTYAPHASNRIQELRRTVHDWVCEAADAVRVLSAPTGSPAPVSAVR